MAATALSTTCVVAGGGPAGLMAGYLLARTGIEVTVLEKHGDFLRDFRGDTIHPSTMEVLSEVGLLEQFLQRPHQELKYAEGELGGQRIRMADFTHLPTRCKFIGIMPQWDFLNRLAANAGRYPNFRLMMEAQAVDLLSDAGRITGLVARTRSGSLDIRADLVIGADGRDSRMRESAGLPVKDLGAPIDVLWFKLASRKQDYAAALGRIEAGQMLVMLDRGEYWQCALVIRKGTADAVKQQGLEAFRARIARLAKRDSAEEIQNLDDVKLLTVKIDRLTRWYKPGLLFIGDAAHAMSPIGGVGINLAIQDAVAAANILAEPLRRSNVGPADLRRVQRRRTFPTFATQALQVAIQNHVVDPALRSTTTPKVPGVIRLMQSWPVLQRIPARLIGIGFRPEHVHTREQGLRTTMKQVAS